MLITAVAFSSVGLLVVVMIWLATSHLVQWHQLQRIKTQATGTPFSVISVAHAFEPGHALLWDTQVPALELINSGGSKGVPLQRLFSWYEGAAHTYPELYDGSSFEQWLEFLHSARLVVRNEYRVALTQEGQEFLHYLVTLARLIAA
jgi:hypothetical protein